METKKTIIDVFRCISSCFQGEFGTHANGRKQDEIKKEDTKSTRLSRALNSKTTATDGRDKMAGSSRKTDEEKIKVVREHILSFAACESHYTRSHHTSGRSI